MIKKKGPLLVDKGEAQTEALEDAVFELKDGEYEFLIFDNRKNRALPQLKYLFGVVLMSISEGLPSHPPINALYKYFSDLYSELHVCDIQGENFRYTDLKTENATEVGNVIDKIIHHAATKWGIRVPTSDELKSADSKELYTDAYIEMWRNYNRNQ